MDNQMIKAVAKEAQREYLRKWRKKNPEKVRDYNRKYWERKVERVLRETEEQRNE